MNAGIKSALQRTGLLAVASFALAALSVSGKEQVFLGPPESGTWSGSEKWLMGMYGGGSTSYDFDDPSHGVCAFVVSNSVPGKGNTADWRCLPFPLGSASGGARPISFSFAYKLSDRVAPGNNVNVQLRFYDAATNFLTESVFPVGAHTGDSVMSSYRTVAHNGIVAPRKARLADITIMVNAFAPWTSGTGRFDDFSVTTVPGPPTLPWLLGGVALVAVGALTVALLLRERRAPVPGYARARG